MSSSAVDIDIVNGYFESLHWKIFTVANRQVMEPFRCKDVRWSLPTEAYARVVHQFKAHGFGLEGSACYGVAVVSRARLTLRAPMQPLRLMRERWNLR